MQLMNMPAARLGLGGKAFRTLHDWLFCVLGCCCHGAVGDMMSTAGCCVLQQEACSRMAGDEVGGR